MARPLTILICAGLTAQVAQAQIGWASYTKDNSRLNANNSTVMNDSQEKDYAWADLDQDGWTDLVIVRKTPYTNPGGQINVLLMNEGGVLTDRTSQYATNSSIANDNGFKTGTNDRDVAIADVNGDGWLDVITSAAIAPNQPKHISHPRVYINQGDMGGAWMGLRYEDALIPDFGTFPNFCAVAVGDLTGDGFPDLYFAHYEQSAQVDLNDKLLVNDGTGSFSDESNARMTSAMLDSSFAVSAVIADMNGDGNNDVVKNTALGSTGAAGPRVIVDYNNPANVGFFSIYDQAYSGAPYHASVGDLNKDGKLDMVISDDASDRYLLNQGNDALGRVKWSAAFTYVANDDGFGSNNIVRDLDNDGWNDVLICDVDVDIPGCSRRMHVFHNKGGTVGGNITLKEESGGGSTGLKGITTSDLRGIHDVAIFDVDNDGDLDLVLGDCNGTNLFVNDLNQPGGPIGTNYCGPAVPNSSGFPAVMGASGSDQVSANNVTLDATMMPTNQFGYFLTSQTTGFIANPGGAQGNLCLGGKMGRYSKSLKNSGSGGSFQLSIDLTNMPPPVQSSVLPGDTWNFVAWFRDKNPTNTSNFTDGLSILFL